MDASDNTPLPSAVVGSQDDKTGLSFDCNVQHWAKTTARKIYSPWKFWAGYKWRLLIFPGGDNMDTYISAYVDCGGPCAPPPTLAAGSDRGDLSAALKQEAASSGTVPASWRMRCRFWISIVPAVRTFSDAVPPPLNLAYSFNETERNWGFPKFCLQTAVEQNGFCDKEGGVTFRVRITTDDCSRNGVKEAEKVLEELKTDASKAKVLTAMNNDELSRTVAAAMLRFEEDMQSHFMELTKCLRTAFRGLAIAGDAIVEFPQPELLRMIVGALKDDRTYGTTFGESMVRILEWRLERFLQEVRPVRTPEFGNSGRAKKRCIEYAETGGRA